MTKFYTAALLIASATSTAAIAAPKNSAEPSYDTKGAYFNCLIPYPGPKGFRTGGCWLDGAIQG